ncbi:hypothetical protein [Hymenobacter persicinus]|uniref:Uncharacterized protein n=1 Tax=Hymenobacter persicinus TaxID=2025506 RepID=A0A4Q5LF14_9BACT|nr:hypothetical protein [Hymenobacter persicinus]RYU83306.1 hypothetical protein EWM57_03195 [Hymenobacter persicinus]
MLGFQTAPKAPVAVVTDKAAYAPPQAIQVRLTNQTAQPLEYVVRMEWRLDSQWLPLDMDVVSNTPLSYTTKRTGRIRKILPGHPVAVSYNAYINKATAPTLRHGPVQARFVAVLYNPEGDKKTRVESAPILIKR